MAIRSRNTNLLSKSGTITLTAVNAGISWSQLSGYTTNIGYASSTDVTSSTANLVLTQDTALSLNSVNIATTGTLTVQPYGKNFTGSTFTWPSSGLTVSSGITGLTIGKDLGSTAHTDTITLGTATSVNGPINVYGGTINIDAGLTSTASGAAILLKSSGDIVVANNTTLQTNDGNIILWSNSSGTGGAIYVQHQVNISSGGGDIWLGGGSTPTSLTAANGSTMTVGNGAAVGSTVYATGVSIGGTNGESDSSLGASILSGGGNITINGQATYSSTCSNNNQLAEGVAMYGGVLVDSGAGKVYIKGTSALTQGSYGSFLGIELGAWGYPYGSINGNGVLSNGW